MYAFRSQFVRFGRIGKLPLMSDDSRHGRKPLHPMSNRSAAEVAAAGDCCRASTDLNARSRSTGSTIAAERHPARNAVCALPTLRFEISEASHILRMSRAQLYHRIGEGAIKIQKDGARTYITAGELERYVEACDKQVSITCRPTA
jgi:hypothetical protein